MGLHGHGGEVNGAQVGLIETTGVIEMKMVVRVVDSGEGIEGEDLVEMTGDAAEEGEDHSVVDGHLEMKTMKNTAPRTNQLCKGGSKIRELQDNSGARIKVTREENDNGETKIEITGSPEVVAKAKELITETVNPVDRMGRSFGRMSTNEASSNSTSDSSPAPVINWAMIRANKDANEKLKFKDLPEIRKNFYIEDPSVANMHPEEIAHIRKTNNDIIVKDLSKDGDKRIPNPVRTFEEAFQHYRVISLCY
uniref:Putative ATP-dependent RNA helicase DDX43 n=1 Tax=Magallana gigas TaxID=29159 RepID=K1QDP9_MAGGI